MRAIINDRRYGALKTLSERKQAFNEVNPLTRSLTIDIVFYECLSTFTFWLHVNESYAPPSSMWDKRKNLKWRRGVPDRKKHEKISKRC